MDDNTDPDDYTQLDFYETIKNLRLHNNDTVYAHKEHARVDDRDLDTKLMNFKALFDDTEKEPERNEAGDEETYDSADRVDGHGRRRARSEDRKGNTEQRNSKTQHNDYKTLRQYFNEVKSELNIKEDDDILKTLKTHTFKLSNL